MRTLFANGYTLLGQPINLLVENNKIILSSSEPINDEYDYYYDLNNQLVVPGLFDLTKVYDIFDPEIESRISNEMKAYLKGGITSIFEYPAIISQKIDYFDMLFKKIEYKNKTSKINFNIFNYYYEGICEPKRINYSLAKKVVLPKLIDESKDNIIKFLNKLDKIFKNEEVIMISVKDPNINNFFKYFKNKDIKIIFIDISNQKEFNRIQTFKEHGFNFFNLIYIDSLFIANDICENEAFRKKYGFNIEFSTAEDCKYFIDMFAKGKLDLLIPNHYPLNVIEKNEKNYRGNPNAETFLLLLFDLCKITKISWEVLNNVLFENPRKIFNIPKHFSLETNANASFSVINTEHFQFIRNKDILSFARWTPYDQKQLWGEITMTVVNGNISYTKDDEHNFSYESTKGLLIYNREEEETEKEE